MAFELLSVVVRLITFIFFRGGKDCRLALESRASFSLLSSHLRGSNALWMTAVTEVDLPFLCFDLILSLCVLYFLKAV